MFPSIFAGCEGFSSQNHHFHVKVADNDQYTITTTMIRGGNMRIGSSIALIVLGAILSFAVRDAIDGVNLVLIGYILMGAGAVGLILSLIFNRPRSQRTAVSTTEQVDPNTGARVVNSESVNRPTL